MISPYNLVRKKINQIKPATMKNFENLSLRAKLLLSFGLIWIMFLIVVLIAFYGIREVTLSEKSLNDVKFKIALELQQLRSHQNFNRSLILELMLTEDSTEQNIIESTINARADSIERIIREVLLLDPDPAFQSRVNELNELQKIYKQTRSEVIRNFKNGQKQDARSFLTGIQDERFEKIRMLAVEMGNKAKKEAQDQLALDMKEARRSTLIFVIIGGVALIFSLFIITTLNKTVSQPLKNLTELSSRIASGNLTLEFKPNSRKDEVGKLNMSFYQMVENLRTSLREISEAINLLGSSASEILAASTQVAAGVSETSSAISETTATVEEVRQAVQLSSQKASGVSDSSKQVIQVTQSGQKAVDETSTVMTDIKTQMESIANTIVRLSEHSQQIGGIIASVDDIADQSNLLAVNAAIEAAKAGEQGKGFSVVAQEIKNLSQQSKQSTVQVRSILSDVQKATTAAVMATEQGSKAVEKGVRQSEQAGEAIRKLVLNVNESVQAATQIVASSQQQVVGMDQVGLAMNNINQAGTENAASVKQAETAAKELHELGQKLKQLVEQYKI